MKVHIRIDIAGALKNRSFSGFVNEDGSDIPARSVEKHFRAQLAKGHRFMPVCDPKECPDFDPFEKGCPGHAETDYSGDVTKS